MINRCLRLSRIAVSLTSLVVLTLALTAPALTLPVVAPWLERIQLIPALAAYSLFTFVVWLMVTLAFGRIYCSTVCPLGTLQDIAARAVRASRSARRRRPYRYTQPRTALRYIFVAAMLMALMLQNVIAVAILDPYSAYAEMCSRLFAPVLGIPSPAVVLLPLPATILAAVIFGASVALAARGGRTICNTVCPVGSTLGLVSRYSVFQIDIDTDKCINCGRCEEVCKGTCINLCEHVVDGSRCVACFDCINVCPNDAIHYTNRRKQLSFPMMQEISSSLKEKQGELGATLNSVKPDRE